MLVIPMWVRIILHQEGNPYAQEACSFFYSPQHKQWWWKEDDNCGWAPFLHRYRNMECFSDILLARDIIRGEVGRRIRWLVRYTRITYSYALLTDSTIDYVCNDCQTVGTPECYPLPWERRHSKFGGIRTNKYRYGYASYPYEEKYGCPKSLTDVEINTHTIKLEGLIVHPDGKVAWRYVHGTKTEDGGNIFRFVVTEWVFYNKSYSLNNVWLESYTLTRTLYPDEIPTKHPDEEELNRIGSRIFLDPRRGHSTHPLL